MNPNQQPADLIDRQLVGSLTDKMNEALKTYSDKEWNYSRISLQTRSLDSIEGPYALWLEIVSTKTEQGQTDMKMFRSEITWGKHHSNELGILEIVSLRTNKALLEVSSDEAWSFNRPVLRVVTKESLAQQGITNALWYKVHEVKGEEFDSR